MGFALLAFAGGDVFVVTALRFFAVAAFFFAVALLVAARVGRFFFTGTLGKDFFAAALLFALAFAFAAVFGFPRAAAWRFKEGVVLFFDF